MLYCHTLLGSEAKGVMRRETAKGLMRPCYRENSPRRPCQVVGIDLIPGSEKPIPAVLPDNFNCFYLQQGVTIIAIPVHLVLPLSTG